MRFTRVIPIIAVLILAGLACGPLSDLTGGSVQDETRDWQATLDAAATQLAQRAPVEDTPEPLRPPGGDSPPPDDSLLAGDLPLFDGDDGYDTTLLQPISIGGSGSGTIYSLSEAHNWVFQGQAGQMVIIRVTGATDEVDTRLKLIDPIGSVLAQDDDSEGWNPVIQIALPSSGLYTARIDAFSEGDYTITVTEGTGGGSGVPSGEELRQWALVAFASSEYGSGGWSAMQATGAPDTFECGDISTAWASATSSGVDWLELYYETPVIPRRIEIHETYNPGATYRVEVIDASSGEYIIVWEGEPRPLTACPAVTTITVSGVSQAVMGVRINIDQTDHTGWNEIDAVELIGTVP